MRPLAIVPAVLCVLAVAGCTTTSAFPLGEDDPSGGLAVSETNDPGVPGQEGSVPVATVHVHSIAPTWLAWLIPSRTRMQRMLTAEATKLGADTIIDIRGFSRHQFEWREDHLMATAVMSEQGGQD